MILLLVHLHSWLLLLVMSIQATTIAPARRRRAGIQHIVSHPDICCSSRQHVLVDSRPKQPPSQLVWLHGRANVYRLHVYRDRVGGEGGFLENTIRISLPKGPPLGFGEICVDFWDFWRVGQNPYFYYY